MQRQKSSFKHESLQDRKSIRQVLDAVADGLSRGELHFNDEDGDISLCPDGLLHFKLTASKEDGRNRFTIRVTWQEEPDLPKKKKALKVNGKKG